ncbi:MAG: hypothetical protein JOZ10_16220 [Acidobacteria bacterium]|nr:hypothetical protein [Acidobacteriota bacterium]MBV9437380.1 hypothetical protein [Acidobacteriota bacterium]
MGFQLRSRVLVALLPAVCLLAASAFDYKPPEIQPAGHADKYPQHETHKDEGVTVAVDPYGPEKDSVFHVKFAEHRILPVRLIISNDSDQPLSLLDVQIEFVTARKAKGEPLTKEDVERAVANSAEPQDRTVPGLPVPIPRKKPQRLPKGTDEEVDYLMFKAKAVEPQNTQSGFLFFDVSGVSQAIAGSHILITGIRNGAGQELFYFDIPLQK